MRLWHLGWWLFLTKIRRRVSHVAQITNSFMFSGESEPLTKFLVDHNFHVTALLVVFFQNSGKKWNFQKLFCGHKRATGGFYKRKLAKKSTLERLKVLGTWFYRYSLISETSNFRSACWTARAGISVGMDPEFIALAITFAVTFWPCVTWPRNYGSFTFAFRCFSKPAWRFKHDTSLLIRL